MACCGFVVLLWCRLSWRKVRAFFFSGLWSLFIGQHMYCIIGVKRLGDLFVRLPFVWGA